MHLLTLAYVAAIMVLTSSFRAPLMFQGIRSLKSDVSISPSSKRSLKESNFCHLLKEHRKRSFVTSRQMTAADMDWDPKSAPKLDFNEDFYSILEVDPEIKGKELKKAYYKIVFKYHPDNKEGKEQKDLCNKQMMVINAAYKILKDDDARVAYDRKRRMGVYGEAAKVGKSSGGSSNSRSQTQTQTQQTQRKDSSYSSNSDPFSGYYRKEPEDSGSTESLGDIFSDFWSEIRKGETKNLVVDLLDFLEDQIPNSQSGRDPMGDIYSQVRSGGKNQESRSKARVDSEVQIMQSAISNLKSHMVDMMKERSDLSAKRTAAPSSSSSIPKNDQEVKQRLQEMEANFRILESIKGLDARIMEVEKQIRLLTRQLQGLLSEQKEATTSTSTSSSYSSSNSNNNSNGNNRNRNSDNMNNNNSNNRYDDSQSRSQSQSQSQSGYQAPPPSSPYTSRSDRAIINASNVEDELVKLKKKMGLK